jgi:hypothetical protein
MVAFKEAAADDPAEDEHIKGVADLPLKLTFICSIASTVISMRALAANSDPQSRFFHILDRLSASLWNVRF